MEAGVADQADRETREEGGHEAQGFVARWSRRKLAQPDPPPSPPSEPEAPAPASPPAPLPETVDDDHSGLFSPEVDEALRRVALRRLFHHPSFNVTDGLDDYAEDYASFEALGDLVTHEMRSALEREERRLAEQEGQSGEAAGEPPRTATRGDQAQPEGPDLARGVDPEPRPG